MSSSNGFAVIIALRAENILNNKNDIVGNTSAFTSSGFGIRYESSGKLKACLGRLTLTPGGQNLVAGNTVVLAVNYNPASELFEFWDSMNQSIESSSVRSADFSLSEAVTLGSPTNNSCYMSGMIGELKMYDESLTSLKFELAQKEMATKWIIDGIDQWWSQVGMDIGGADEDFDGDGLSNLIEVGLGGDPLNKSIHALLPSLGVWNGSMLEYSHLRLRNAEREGIVYKVLTSPDLITWNETGAEITETEVLDNEMESVKYAIDPGPDASLFISLQIETN
ncbi:MAG: hypothetical protein AAGA18_01230 [Verrucomicrobiota bacterium]